ASFCAYNLRPTFRTWRAGRHHRPCDAIAPKWVDLQSPRVERARIRASNPKPDASHMDDIRATFSGRGKFQPSFFLPLFGPGKIPGEAFFCHCFGEPCRRGGCWGCDVRLRLGGDLTGGRARQRQRAMRVRGSAQGREMSLTRFVFFSVRVRSNLSLYAGSIVREGAAVCRIASPTAMAAAIATLSERKPSRIGMTSRASAAACTFSGTPDVSRPNSKTSPCRTTCAREKRRGCT